MTKWFRWCIAGTALATACTKEPVYIDSVSVSDNPALVSIDTFQVKALVYRLDSFQTGGTGVVLAGTHNDPVIGRTTAEGYFVFQIPSVDYNSIGSVKDVYDSIVFTGRIHENYYGDTTVPYTVSLNLLSQEVYTESGEYYNTNSFAADGVTLGTFSRTVRPVAGDSVRIKLDDSFGQQFFQLYREKNAAILNNSDFQRWFKGIKITPDPQTGAVLGFATGDSSVRIRLYYHTNDIVVQKKEIEIFLGNSGDQFTALNTMTTGTAFQNLNPGSSLNSEQTGNTFAILPLAGIRTAFYCPSVRAVPTLGDFVQLLTAQLTIYPHATTSYKYPDPFYMYLRKPDLSYEGPLAYSSGEGAQTGDLVTDPLYGKDTYYTWDVGAYISSEVLASDYSSRRMVPITDQTTGSLSASSWFQRLTGSSNSADRTLKLTTQALIYQYQK